MIWQRSPRPQTSRKSHLASHSTLGFHATHSPCGVAAWRVNSACVWRRCMVFDAASGLKAGIVAPLLAAITSLMLAASR